MSSDPSPPDLPGAHGAPLRLLIVAGDPLARAALAGFLAEFDEVHVIGQLAADRSLLTDLDAYRPDILLWDFGWDADEVPVTLADVELPTMALLPDETLAAEAWGAGARGLLLRDSDAERLITALLALDRDLLVLDPALAGAIRPELSTTDAPLPEPLTPREQEVLQLLAEGLSNRAIGQQLQISEHTVKFHVTAIMGKLDAQSRTEAVVRATRLGLILL
ncbi:MAG TPA: response regulator transcription factor [Candidatus Sulfomarinibacteraceae bacterium]|nr:response regulator transcription factor [Candidatus Sulfomarinibacteraceae bacterium]